MLSALSCSSSVIITDDEFCGDMGKYGATCAHTLKPDTRDIPKPEWDALRFGWICSSPASFANKKRELEQLCARPGSCTLVEKAIQKRVGDFLARVESVSAKIQKRMHQLKKGNK